MYPTAQKLSLNLWVQYFCFLINNTFEGFLKQWKYLYRYATILLYILYEYHSTNMDIPYKHFISSEKYISLVKADSFSKIYYEK